MRLHISIADDVVGEVDRRVGARRRSAFIESALRRVLEEHARPEALEQAFVEVWPVGH